MDMAQALIGSLLSDISSSAHSLTRAVQPPSEKVVRVLSTLMVPLEICHTMQEHGAERLHINAAYVLFDNFAELHAPKDSTQRELQISSELEARLRQQVLQDVFALSAQNVPLSAEWWRQLGMEETAQQVEQGLVTASQRARAEARAALTGPEYNIDRIVKEVPTAGAAKIWFLVQWEGYNPDWERWRISGQEGEPLQTWEPLKIVRRTEAYSSWQAAKRQARLEHAAAQ